MTITNFRDLALHLPRQSGLQFCGSVCACAVCGVFFHCTGKHCREPSLVGWESFDGAYSTSSSDLQENPILYGSVSTDASGNISNWAFTVGIAQTPADGETALSESSCNLVEPCSNIFGGAPFDYVQANVGNLPYVAAGSETAGTWTSTATTPEPNFFWLLNLGAGLLVLIKLYQRRRVVDRGGSFIGKLRGRKVRLLSFGN